MAIVPVRKIFLSVLEKNLIVLPLIKELIILHALGQPST